MPSQRYNLLIEQGSRFQRSLQMKLGNAPRLLTGFSAQAQIRKKYQSEEVVASFTISIDESLGKIHWRLSSSQTALLPANCQPADVPKNFQRKSEAALPTGLFVWDLELIDPQGERDRLLFGSVLITPGVTR